jgi:hypothetical protein
MLIMLVTLCAAFSLPYFRKLNDAMPDVHPGLVAVISGIIVTAITYPALVLAEAKYGLSLAILQGLLVAEFVVFGAPPGFPTPVAISFFFFMLYYGFSEAEHLWPDTYA